MRMRRGGVQIDVLLFGPQAELAGTRTLRIEADGDPPTAREVMALIAAAAPSLAGGLSTSRLAINHEFAADGDPVSGSDEVALVGMVSGG